MDCGVITSKTVLLLLSLAFWAAAAGLSYVGGYVMNTYRSYDNFLQDKYALLPAVIILCVAAVMFIIGLLGCCATFRESRVGLGLFLAIILIIFIAEVSAFVLAFVYREKVKSDVQGTMRAVFDKYDGKNSESAVMDYLQENLHCCGVKNYSDWTTTQWFNSTGNNSVPLSCCKQNLKNCTGSLDQPQELNTQGCSGELEAGLQSVISYAMLVILGFAIVKFFGMLSVCVLTCKREDSGYQPLYSGVFA
ncbi:tetraspanin-36 isoform X1 [Anas platyrhynchos]|uniref:Tetraspanin n=2 Tax=Anas TaxID=8835 RepID=A0A8B9VYL9_9AVES|nr:tetraspanin-36 [Anas platyrhynchos]|eukprot:XP_027302081.1 tetraspanin-36 isoform X1 [Anas platyrhynchos]